jgi:RNA polymerase sigma factor (sigma-70 family)
VTGEIDPPEELLRDNWELVRAWVRRDRRQSEASPLDDSAIAGSVFEEALRIWRRTPPDQRHSRDTWAPWLRSIMNYKIYEAVRENVKQQKAVRALSAETIPRQSHVGDTADEVVSREYLESVRDSIGALTEPDRTILLLLWGGRSVGEAAQQVGLTREAAAMRVTRIRKYLKGEGGFAQPGDDLKALRDAFGQGQE